MRSKRRGRRQKTRLGWEAVLLLVVLSNEKGSGQQQGESQVHGIPDLVDGVDVQQKVGTVGI